MHRADRNYFLPRHLQNHGAPGPVARRIDVPADLLAALWLQVAGGIGGFLELAVISKRPGSPLRAARLFANLIQHQTTVLDKLPCRTLARFHSGAAVEETRRRVRRRLEAGVSVLFGCNPTQTILFAKALVAPKQTSWSRTLCLSEQERSRIQAREEGDKFI